MNPFGRKPDSWRRPAPGLLVAILLGAGLLPGCGHFLKLKKEVKRLETDVYLGGVVPATGGEPVFIAVYRQGSEGEPGFFDAIQLGKGETVFGFSLPPAPDYSVIALVDRNGNRTYDSGEPWWSRSPVGFDANRRSAPLEARWAEAPMPQELQDAWQKARGGGLEAGAAGRTRVPVALGQLVDWNQPRFALDPAGGEGLWQPATALNRYGLGIWFLEPYDPQRIPVLLVHGLGGTAGDWREFGAKLDAKRFQVWVYAYPSGLRIDESADALERGLARLHARYGFARLDVVAHSMGGLVARRALLDAADRGHAGWIRNFVTLSTPWSGHEAAAMGVDYAPATVPAWIDLQTDSEFTRRLRVQPLPAGMTHHLGFTFAGRNLPFLPPSNDGVVSVASQLAPPMQENAADVRGFDLPHAGPLHSDEAARWVGQCLK